MSDEILVRSVSVLKLLLYAKLLYGNDLILLNCGMRNFNASFSISFEMKDKFVTGLSLIKLYLNHVFLLMVLQTIFSKHQEKFLLIVIY